RDRRRGLLAGVDQLFAQRTDDAVTTGVDLADPVLVLACRLDNATGTCIDDRGDATRLGVEKVCLGHERVPCAGCIRLTVEMNGDVTFCSRSMATGRHCAIYHLR